MTTVVIAESDGVALERLKTAAVEAGCTPDLVPSLEVALTRLESLEHAVLLVGPSLVGDAALELAERVISDTDVTVVLAAPQVDALLLRRSMRAGIADCVAVTEPISELTEAIVRAVVASERAGGSASPANDAAPQKGRLCTVFSTKGGVGKSVLAINLAVALAKNSGKRVAVVDLNLEAGDVSIMLGLRPTHTILDAAQAFDRLDVEMLEGFMEPHSSGVLALLAPLRPEDAEAISAGRVGQILDIVRAMFDFVVVDTPPSFTEAVLAALDRSDEIFLVTMMDVASIKNTRIALQKLKQLGYDNGNIRLILNRSDSKVLLEPSQVEEAIGLRVAGRIPSDRVVPRSVNKGAPVVADMPRSEVSKSVTALASLTIKAAQKGDSHVA